MSREDMAWLNQFVLIGLADIRGKAWHHRADLQGTESNHYGGFIPVDDVARRLFNFGQSARPLAVLLPDDNGNVIVGDGMDATAYRAVIDEDHIAVCDNDGIVLGVHGAGYQVHGYEDWLLKNVATILDDDIGISSAGLLRQRRQAWCEVSVPENIVTPEGVEFRPNLLAYTSHDSSLATTYKRTVGLVVCDNTLAARIAGIGERVSYRHTSGSITRVAEARAALGIIHDAADEFSAMVREFCAVEVSDRAWSGVLDALFPYPIDEATGKVAEGRRLTTCQRKREEVENLYRWDERAATWQGTKFGVVQAFNTWKTHQATVKGATRAERNMVNTLGNQGDTFDANVADTVDQVLAAIA